MPIAAVSTPIRTPARPGARLQASSARTGRGLRRVLLAAFVAAPALFMAGEAAGQAPGQAASQARDTVLVLDTIPVLGSRVSAELPLRTRSVQVMDRATLESIPARSVGEALRWATGVEVQSRSPAQTDLSIRGGSFEQLLVLVDGVRMSDPQTGHFDLDLTVPLDRVERIEILRGPASAQYGSDAVGGVVNIVTRRTPDGVGGRVEVGSFGTLVGAIDATAGLPGGLALELAGEAGRSDGHRTGTEWEQLLGTMRLAAPVSGGRLLAEGGLARRDFGAEAFYAPFPSFEATRTETASLAWVPGAASRLRVEPRVSWRGHDDDFILIRDNPSVYQNVHRSTQAGADLTVRMSPTPGVTLAAGGEVARHRLASNALGDRSETRSAVHLEMGARPVSRLDLSLGLRHDDHARWGGFTSPSVAAAWTAAPQLRVRASWGRSFRGPTWTERYYADPGHEPNPDVRPERGEAWEVGVQVEPLAGVSFQLAGFTRTNRDLIDWARRAVPAGVFDISNAPWVPRNVNEARFRGVELETSWQLDAGTQLTLSGTLLSLEADAEPGFRSKYALRPLAEQVMAGFRHDIDDVSVFVRGMHGRRAGEEAFREIDVRLDAPLPGGMGRGARVFMDVRNVLGSDHLDLTSNPVPGRAIYLGVRTGTR
ncbi:MAG: TonB-dependent receptor [Gemmatimonadales bacterium]|nr:MAG: TonB-dependent receptor [Gemmatimonadales bacterium]